MTCARVTADDIVRNPPDSSLLLLCSTMENEVPSVAEKCLMDHVRLFGLPLSCMRILLRVNRLFFKTFEPIVSPLLWGNLHHSHPFEHMKPSFVLVKQAEAEKLRVDVTSHHVKLARCKEQIAANFLKHLKNVIIFEGVFGPGTKSIDLALLPPSVQRVEISTDCNLQISNSLNLPFLSHINISSHSNAKLVTFSPLPSLQHLTLQGVWVPTTFDLGQHLTTLNLGTSFTGHLQNLPPSLTDLNVGSSYNNDIDNLPPHLQTLSIGNIKDGSGTFDLPIDHLPGSLKRLQLIGEFDQPVDHLPIGLQSLDLSNSNFDCFVDHLPPGLMQLQLGEKFTQHAYYLPEGLLDLSLPQVFVDSPFEFARCSRLEKLHVLASGLDNRGGRNIMVSVELPCSLISLSIIGGLNFDIYFCNNKSFSALRKIEVATLLVGTDAGSVALQIGRFLEHNYFNALVELIFPMTFNGSVDNLPPSLHSLTLGAHFNQDVDHLPSRLVELKITNKGSLVSAFNRPVDNLPGCLTRFIIEGDSIFNHPVDHIPSSMCKLVLYKPSPWNINHNHTSREHSRYTMFDQELAHLPSKLVDLEISTFKGKLDRLPSGLKCIVVVSNEKPVFYNTGKLNAVWLPHIY